MGFRRLLRIDWDVVAGIIAALTAMLLSFMGLVSETVGLGIILLLGALLRTRDLRGEAREPRMFESSTSSSGTWRVWRRFTGSTLAARWFAVAKSSTPRAGCCSKIQT